MKRLLAFRIWGLVLSTAGFWFGCGGGLGPSGGGTGAGAGPLGASGSGTESSGGAAEPGGTSASGGTTSSGAPGTGGTCSAGTESCPCYGNDTCNAGLACLSHVCVNPIGTGGTATGGTATGGVATGGTATGGVATGGTSTGGRATGGVATGGRATGGVATGGAVGMGGGTTGPGCTPDGPCAGQSCPSCIVFTTTSYISGNLGTDASCYETTAAIQDGNCGNFVVPRTLTINGTDMDCATGRVWSLLPAKVNGGYCFVISAGNQAWAYFGTY